MEKLKHREVNNYPRSDTSWWNQNSRQRTFLRVADYTPGEGLDSVFKMSWYLNHPHQS